MKVLLLGARGQLGSAISRIAPTAWGLMAADRTVADLASPGQVADLIVRTRPAVVINAAAWTNVDGAESSEALATRINGEAVAEAAQACGRVGGRLVQLSTDYVFDGSGDRPWTEESEPAPLNAYGRSKVVGERACLTTGHAMIVRTSWLHGGSGRHFVRSILGAAAEHDTLRVVSDQIGAPTEARWLAATIVDLADRLARGGVVPSIVHAVPSGHASWHEVACHALRTASALGARLRCTADAITPVPSADYPLKAMRPMNSRLDGRRLDALVASARPSWTVGVDATVRALVRGGA